MITFFIVNKGDTMKTSDLKISDDKNNIVVYDVIELQAVACGGCSGCFFLDYELVGMCGDVPCYAGERQDGNSVIFMRLDEVAEVVLK